jgi:phosphoglycolate phosphatase-like HAD superfamily hydrolase
VLFDIDGTLIRTPGAGREALARAAAAVFDVPLERSRREIDTIEFRGTTDVFILERFGELLGVAMNGHGDLMARYIQELDGLLGEMAIEVMPGVVELIDALYGAGETHVGLLTGNVREGARRKLDRVGLGHLLDGPGGFGEAGRERAAVVRAALAELEPLGVVASTTVIIGDTPIDVEAAQSCGARGVAVATGWTSREELEACGADLFLPDLSNPEPLWRFLDAL